MRIAIVGRPNVGKSALFNRMIGKKQALVYDSPGVTRDWLEHPWSEQFPAVLLIDTPGWVARPQTVLEEAMVTQTVRLIQEADALLWVLDGQAGITPEEYLLMPLLRSGKPLWLVINKCEAQKTAKQVVEFYALGMGDPWPVSAQHGLGVADLMNTIERWFEEQSPNPKPAVHTTLGDCETNSMKPTKDRPVSFSHSCDEKPFTSVFQEEASFDPALSIKDISIQKSFDFDLDQKHQESEREVLIPDPSFFQGISLENEVNRSPMASSKVIFSHAGSSPSDPSIDQKNQRNDQADIKPILHKHVTTENLSYPQSCILPLAILPNSQRAAKNDPQKRDKHSKGESHLTADLRQTTNNHQSHPQKQGLAREKESVDPSEAPEDPVHTVIQFAFIGRPNVGKSSLANRLLGEARFIVSPIPGTTRDAMAADFIGPWGHTMRLVDTAGIRRWSAVQDPLEIASVQESRRALNFCHVVVLVLDATIAFEKQDLTLARKAETEGRALVIALNQWDRIPFKKRKQVLDQARYHCDHFPYLRNARLVPLSALYDQEFKALLRAITQAYHAWNKRVGTGALNAWLSKLLDKKPHPMVHHKPVRLKYIAQVSIRPPKFIASGNRLEHLDPAYERFLHNQLVQSFGFWGVPLRIQYRSAYNPYQDKNSIRER